MPLTRKTAAASTSFDVDKAADHLEILLKYANHFSWQKAFAQIPVLLSVIPQLKLAVTLYRNTLLSVQEGLRDGALTRQEASKELFSANLLLKEAYDVQLENLNSKKLTLQEKRTLLEDLHLNTLKVYDRNMNEVQTRLGREGLFLGFAPVLPLMSPPLDHSKLKALGIPSRVFADYVILERQFVVGVSQDYIKTTFGLGPRQTATPKQSTIILDEIRDLVRTRFRSKSLTEMAEPASWWGAQWMWFVSKGEFKQLRACTIADSSEVRLRVRSWSFPFKR